MTYAHMSAEQAQAAGLKKIYLYPAEFNGSNQEKDTRWVPPEAYAEKVKFDAMVKKRFDDGRIGAYLCSATDVPGSVVPARLKLSAYTRGIPVFVAEIDIWEPASSAAHHHP